jgi:Tol biopolymer transport system component
MVTDKDLSRSTAALSLNTGDRIPLAAQVPASSARTAFSPDGRHVAFVDFTQGNQDIYVLTLETRERHRVTTAPEIDRDAVWSPDGSTILYHNPLGTWAIGMVDGRVEGAPRLVRGEPNSATWNWNTSWTANGYYYVSQQSVIRPYRIAIDPETKEALGAPELIDDPMPDLRHNARFSWSPDMQRIASVSGERRGGRIHVTRGQGLTSFQIGDLGVSILWWSQDGAEILYTTRASGQRDVRKTVYSLDPENGRIRELFPPTERGNHIHVSPDGARMVFFRPVQPDPDSAVRIAGELVVSDLGDFTGGRVLAQSSDPEGELSTYFGQPLFSPDGSRILFFRVPWVDIMNGNARMSLWVIPADGSAPARRLAEAPRIDPPYWDPSGRWIVFKEYRGSDLSTARGMISIVSLETGKKHEILSWGRGGMTAGDLILSTQLKTWSPDGRWIGITQGTGSYEYWVVDDPLGEQAGRGR